ncbi:tRNA (adenosine(37)-N6)-threonylcarbamoyltransferase complex ATPase subunit type 1 TsaE [Ferrovibrio sp.]|uniref:tRNA (adenosine(37)-N6)-threonylcarbamoyltransferase complex ATPase subunit type 1 TsaE n=1 Tax=Ferrovibrio sp. TaxID=1917215 RepID=UPI000CC8CCC3|nr:tRNA (adenosine(37)-N6)-threonylcarbamoyltransferase complex ATPase subunit type 1 TsaE [Ferrovibrio sp.]PJI42017.1 MAG: tRNA (adenosine(37)-N6)-threonylcarbamoyltransferase complex ATPase subunit type 1 TsaE [Ferrovibrio sp.]
MPMIRRYQLPDEAATAALGMLLADRLQPGDAILLDGALGVGKTCFARALIRHLSGNETEVPSPSFNLVLTYDIPQGMLWHFDLYRIGNPRELDELGLDDALRDGVTLVEWPDRLGSQAPAGALTVSLSLLTDAAGPRRADLTGNADWATRLADLPETFVHDADV